MKRKVALLLTLALMLTAVTGCGSASQPADQSASQPADQSASTDKQAATEETAGESADESAAGKIKMITWSNAGTVDALKELNAKFQSETGIEVELTEVPSTDYESLLNTRLAANDVDIFCYTTDSRAFAQPVVDWAPMDQLTWESIITGGNALDLSGYDWIKNWNTGAEVCRYNDGIYGIATGMTLMNGIFYNKKMFDDNGWTEPTTWDEFINLCEKIKATGVAPLTVGGGDTWPCQMSADAIVHTVEQGNENDLSEALWTGKRTYTDETSMKVFERQMEFLSYMEDGFMGIAYSDVPARLVAGKAAMLYDGSWNAAQIESVDPNFEYGYFALPGDDVHNFAGKYDLTFGINAKSANTEAAAKWLEFFSQPENYTIYINSNGFVPTMSGIESTNRFLQILGSRVDDVDRTYECYNRIPTNVGVYGSYDPTHFAIAGGEFDNIEDRAEAAQKDWDEAVKAAKGN